MRPLRRTTETAANILIDDKELTMNIEMRSCPTDIFFFPLLRRAASWISVSDDSNDPKDLASTIAASVESAPREHRQALWANVVLTGGNAQTSGLRDRLSSALVGLTDGYDVHITIPDAKSSLDFLNMSWIGTSKYASNPLSQNRFVRHVIQS